MTGLVSRLRPIWPALTLLGSGALLAGAHAFERIGGLAPCPLCLDQRNWHWAVVAVSIAALVALRFRPGWARWAAALVGLVLLGSAGMAAYHVAVEQHWLVAQCDVRGSVDFDSLGLDNLGDNIAPPRCDEVAWSMFGISMAGYNGIVSLILALASFFVASAPERKV